MKTLELGGHCSRFPPWKRAWWQPYSDCKLQTRAGIRGWSKLMRTPISVIQINKRDY